MEKLFNLRFGGDKKGDTLPNKFILEPIAECPSQGRVVDLAPMVADFYQAMNWDEAAILKVEVFQTSTFRICLQSFELQTNSRKLKVSSQSERPKAF
jgi:aldehyde:ferredoxin oxidoreductase